MSNKIDVVEIIETFKKEIEGENIPIWKQYLASEYYARRMNEYREQSDIVIFGAGKYGKFVYKMLSLEKIQTARCFCDNSASEKEWKIGELDVLTPQEAIQRFPNAMYIITPRLYENEMLRQLVDLGIDVRHISIFVMDSVGMVECM